MGDRMQAVRPPEGALRSENPPAHEEARINRLAWASWLITVSLAVAAAAFFLLSEADRPWQRLAYPILIGAPVAYSIISAHYIRWTHVALLRRSQAQLVIRTAELQEMASRDELTQLYNRRYFYERIQAQLAETRYTKEPLALLLLDVDGLKGINDEHGHLVGDRIIANLGKIIAKHTRNSDVPARLGGDEFAVLMPHTDKLGTFALAQRLWEELEQTPMFEDDGKSIRINVSIGVSGFPWGGEDVDEMMHWADADMYVNKVSRRLPPQAIPQNRPRGWQPLPDDFLAGV